MIAFTRSRPVLGQRCHATRHPRALFDWSDELLSDAERSLFRGLAVFVGAWSLEEAETVCGDAAIVGAPTVALSSYTATISREDVLVLLLGLVDKSLVLVQEREGEARYPAAGEDCANTPRRSCTKVEKLVYVERHTPCTSPAWWGHRSQPVQEVIERVVSLPLGLVAGHADNLRAALGYIFDEGDAEAGLSMVARIYHLWQLRGPREEGQEWLRRFLTMPAPGATPSRPAALFAAGWMATFEGDVEKALTRRFAEATWLAQARGDLAGCAYARTKLGVVASLRGDTARSRAESEEGARFARAADAPVALLESLVQLAYLALSRGDLEDVRDALSEAWAVLPRFPGRQRYKGRTGAGSQRVPRGAVGSVGGPRPAWSFSIGAWIGGGGGSEARTGARSATAGSLGRPGQRDWRPGDLQERGRSAARSTSK